MTDDLTIEIPDPCLVVLAGPAGCGKSTFAGRHFPPGDLVSSDECRKLVSGDPADQSATSDAFGLLRSVLDKRLRRRRPTVVDATNLTKRERRRILGLARKHEMTAVAIAFDLPLEVCQRRAADRRERPVATEVVARQHETFRRHLDGLPDEGFDEVHVLRSIESLSDLTVRRRQIDTRSGAMSTDRPATAAPTPRRPAIVIDLDGTLTSAWWREHHLTGERRDWAAFFAGMARDAPVRPLVDLAGWVARHAAVVLLTGRPDEHADAIRQWLTEHEVVYDELLMRRRGDRRRDTVVKRERYRDEIAPRYDVRLVVEDRPRVIEMWREEGLYVLTAVDPRLDPLPIPQ